MIHNEVGVFKKAWYIIQIIGLSIFYFLYAIVVGPWEWVKEKFQSEC